MTIDIANMSDEEIANLDIDALDDETLELAAEEFSDKDLPDDLSDEDKEESDESENEEEANLTESEESGEKDSEDDEAKDDEAAESKGEQSVNDEGADEHSDDSTDGEGKLEADLDEVVPEKASKPSTEKSDADVSDLDKTKGFDTLMGKFKANGVDIQPKTVDDALNLMKMGANYHKKMVAVKPYLNSGRTLEKHNIDEERLNFLIDLHNGDEAAITKLVKDSKVNPLSIDVETDTSYKSKSYAISDKEVNLKSALEDVQGTPTGDRTIDIISNKWDKTSGDFIASKPEILTVINDHVAAGYYDKIMEEVERQKVFGNLNGMSSYEAYQKVGNELFSQDSASTEEEQEVAVKARRKVTPDSKVKDKKRAASTTKATSSNKANNETFDITQMSDAEVNALIASGKY